MLEQSEGLHPMERTHAGAVCEGLQPMGRTNAREAHGGLSPVGGTLRWSRGRVRSPPPEEEGAAETTCGELTPTPIPHPPALLGDVGRESTSEAVPRKKGGVGGRCFKVWFYFSLPYSG